MSKEFSFIASSLEGINELLTEYCNGLTSPMDSFVEDYVLQSKTYTILAEGVSVGFFCLQETSLVAFYVVRSLGRHAAPLFSQVIAEFEVKDVYFQTSDSLLVSLVMDWEFEKKKSANFFEDAKQVAKPVLNYPDVTFLPIRPEEFAEVQEATNNFFDKNDIANGNIFILRSGKEILGCGIGVRGRLFKSHVSIGMVTCKAHRRQGVGKYILCSLKEWCYEQGLTPVAGCWYYNTLSKRSLESAGMASRSRGMRAVLTGKEDIPERTGNPPGEPVE